MDQSIRLNKFLAERLGLSRREADEAILSHRVTVDGKEAILGQRIDKNAKVCYNREIVAFLPEYSYIAMNKPAQYVCSRKRQGETPTIYELLPESLRKLKTVGRLDKDSSGLILLTNDGDFAFRMTHPRFMKEKHYEVVLDRELEPLHQQMISDYGVEIGDGVSKFAVIRLDGTRKKFEVILREGRNRQIRRTFAALGYKVMGLHRTSFGNYSLSGLKEGEYVELPAPSN